VAEDGMSARTRRVGDAVRVSFPPEVVLRLA